MSGLPVGFGVVGDPSLRKFGDGRVLMGGTPLRVLRVTDAGRRQCEALLGGAAVEPTTSTLARRLVDAGLAHPRPPRATQPTASVTVVIPVRDRAKELAACLVAVGDVGNVIVVDDGSQRAAPVAEVCETDGVLCLRLPESRGPAGARNAALSHVRTDLVAFVDSDAVPEPGWLDTLTRHFADPAVGAAAPRILPLTPERPSLLARYAAARSPLDMGAHEAAVVPSGAVAYVPTATLVVRLSAVSDGFDESLRCGEDVDLVWRLHDAGWRVRYDPGAVVRHCEPTTWRGFLTRHRYYGESAAALSRRHPGRAVHLVISPLPTATGVAFLLGRPRATLTLGVLQVFVVTLRWRSTGIPLTQSWEWTTRWNWGMFVGLGRAATMFGAPALVAGMLIPRTRRSAAALALVVPVTEFAVGRPPMNAVVWAAACIADDFAYGLGVLTGCVRTRTLGPLRPRWAWRMTLRRQGREAFPNARQ